MFIFTEYPQVMKLDVGCEIRENRLVKSCKNKARYQYCCSGVDTGIMDTHALI